MAILLNTARLIQVIETTLATRGKGTPEDPHRIIVQYWSIDGDLLAERDEFAAYSKVRER